MKYEFIQTICPSLHKILSRDDKLWMNSVDDCIVSMRYSKGSLIELLFEFDQAGHVGLRGELIPWVAEMVSSDDWTDSVHTYFMYLWDNSSGECENLKELVLQAFDRFYSLD